MLRPDAGQATDSMVRPDALDIRMTSSSSPRTILRTGDRVAIIAPAAQFRRDEQGNLEEACDLLESWGLRPSVHVEPAHHFYLAGTDEARLRHLIEVLEDPDIKALFCAKGGYGSARLLRHLPRPLQVKPRMLVGYSDITALHIALRRVAPAVQSIHGPNIATAQLLADTAAAARNREALRAAIFDADYTFGADLDFIRSGEASGPIVGGCLSLVASLVGTPWVLDTAGAILFLEDGGERPYRIDRMLTHLQDAGLFDDVGGVVFGDMHNCVDEYNELSEIIADIFRDARFPIAIGLESGHGPVNLALPLGEQAMLSASRGSLSLSL